FCSIQNEKDEARIGVLERGCHWYILLNMFPYTGGHIMIVANRHIGGLEEVTEPEGTELMAMLARSERALTEAYHPEGMNIGINLGAAAGAGIAGHLHVHLCPRWTGDTNFMTALAETRVVSEALEESYRKLAPHFRQGGERRR
ncbi:MAG: HIT domain-containing protein, partial [Candidatus Krumholzibacteria bacterium]|nr:HIT domain-containing protein [Candidatus Krumholzibacteria bacterium]